MHTGQHGSVEGRHPATLGHWNLGTITMRDAPPWTRHGPPVLAVLALIALRMLLLGSWGYIHPDEFCQGPEVVAGNLPWEFDQEHALRSPVWPHVAWRPGHGTWWWSSRIVPFLASMLVDAWVLKANPRVWLVWATSWSALILMVSASYICCKADMTTDALLFEWC